MGEKIENGTIHVGEIIGKTLDGKDIYKFTEVGTAENVEIREPQYEDGDFVVSKAGSILIFKEKVGNSIYDHAYLSELFRMIIFSNTPSIISIERHATEEEKQKMLDALAEEGKRWDEEEKCIEDLPKRKFKVGDKVRIKEGISSKTHKGVGPSFVSTMDKFIGQELTVKWYSSRGWGVFCGDGLEYEFAEEWLEPYTDELKEGDLAIFWDDAQSEALIGVYNQFYDGSPFPHEDHIGNGFKNAVKFESKEQFEKLINGEL